MHPMHDAHVGQVEHLESEPAGAEREVEVLKPNGRPAGIPAADLAGERGGEQLAASYGGVHLRHLRDQRHLCRRRALDPSIRRALSHRLGDRTSAIVHPFGTDDVEAGRLQPAVVEDDPSGQYADLRMQAVKVEHGLQPARCL